MKVLIVGGGGREHALAWKVAASTDVEQVFVAPGNGGTHMEQGVTNVAIEADDIAGLLDFALDSGINLTIVGPEVPLVEGIVDQFQEHKLRIFGPTARAAQLEGSKSFCKDFLDRHQIPTATYGSFTDSMQALDYIRKHGAPLVVKADGLAAGKGVVIAHTLKEAEDAAIDMLSGNRFGEAGNRVVIEEFLEGEELSFICMVDGTSVLPMATSQDHKARDDGDLGPNTGGMGAYSPAAGVSEALHQRIMETIIKPTVSGMQMDGNPFRGFLYAGLMINAAGDPKVLEYNVRFGDPETQPILMRLQSDLVALCNAAIDGKLDQFTASWSAKTAIGIVMAAGGYPDSYRKGDAIAGLQTVLKNTKVFHAGSIYKEEKVVTNGGRVLCVTAMADDIVTARSKAYEAVDKISWDQVYFRRDIGHRAVARQSV